MRLTLQAVAGRPAPAAPTQPLRLSWATALAIAMASPVAGQTAAPATAGYELPPVRFARIDDFLTAIAIDEEVRLATHRLWEPAIAAIVAANPAKAAAARAFAQGRRDREVPQYRPLIAYQVDRAAARTLDPRFAARLDALTNDGMALTRSGGDDRREAAIGQKIAALEQAASAPTQKRLAASITLAQTPDGLALRALNRAGLYRCLPQLQPRGLPGRAERRRAECAAMLADPALGRLQATDAGRGLVGLSATAHVSMLGMMAMGHAAGTRPRQLIAFDDFAAAGLVAP